MTLAPAFLARPEPEFDPRLIARDHMWNSARTRAEKEADHHALMDQLQAHDALRLFPRPVWPAWVRRLVRLITQRSNP